MLEKKKIALVLSTGGARGIAHIGVIEELIRQNYQISSIAGCSMGAVIGAAYATGYWDECKEVLQNINNKNFFQFTDFTINRKGLIKGNKIYKKLEQIFSDIRIEDLKIPFAAVATNALNQQEVIFKKGKIVDALRASISLPFIFHPYEFNNMCLIDGGILNPLPLDIVPRLDNDIMIGVSVGERKNKLNIFKGSNIIMDSVTMLIQSNIRKSCKEFNPDIMIQVEAGDYSILNFSKYTELVKAGVEATQEALLNQ